MRRLRPPARPPGRWQREHLCRVCRARWSRSPTRWEPPALRSLHIHLSGIAYGPKGEKKHLELKDADLNFNELFRALADFKCGGRILCESPVMEDDALVLKSTWCEVSGESLI